MRSLGNEELGRLLTRGPYRHQALVPPCPWLDDDPPPPPRLHPGGQGRLVWEPAPGEQPFLYVVHLQVNGTWTTRILPATCQTIQLPRGTTKAALSAVDRQGNESLLVGT